MARIRGTNRKETLLGTAANDIILGLGGDDTLKGGAGNDKLDGGACAHDVADYSASITGVTVDLTGVLFTKVSAATPKETPIQASRTSSAPPLATSCLELVVPIRSSVDSTTTSSMAAPTTIRSRAPAASTR